MELISDNTLNAFVDGVSTPQEDMLVMNEGVRDEAFSELVEILKR
jgi:hypothetical protein